MAGMPDFAGTALVHGVNIVTSAETIILSPGQTQFPFFQFNKPGYLISIFATVPAGTAKPFLDVAMFWEDTNGTNYEIVSWLIPATSSGGHFVVAGSGPVRGPNLNLHIKNLDTVNSMTVTMSIMETTHHIARDDWRAQSNDFNTAGTVPGATLAPNFLPTFNILTMFSNSALAGNFSQAYLLPVYAGQAFLFAEVGPSVRVTMAPFIFGTGIPISTAQAPPLWDQSNTGTSPVTFTAIPITLPRYPVSMSVVNSSASASSLQLSLVGQEYAS